jgi:hypothetical protein
MRLADRVRSPRANVGRDFDSIADMQPFEAARDLAFHDRM